MDLIANYSGEAGGESSGGEEEASISYKPLAVINAAPTVNATGLALVDNQAVPASQLLHYQAVNARKVFHNLPYDQLHAPTIGPVHPHHKDAVSGIVKNHRAGFVEDHHTADFHFDEQYNTFHSYGYAVAPMGHYVGDQESFDKRKGESVYSMPGKDEDKPRESAEQRAAKRRAMEAERDPDEPWALQARLPWVDRENPVPELTEEHKEYIAQMKLEKGETDEADGEQTEKTHFHGKEKADYSGRSWLEPPKDKRAENDYCYLPKRWVHTWSGHTKGVNAIRFFPATGHLLLSAGLDGKIKMWDVNTTQKCMRTYMGHSKGVRDINFSNDGRQFLSSSYDKAGVKLWDTETGQVITTLGKGKMFYVAKLHPEKQDVLMAGCGDNQVYQWDVASGNLVQTYTYHLGAVNTITFVDEGRRFVTTSDDKTIRAWEFGINVEIKYIADPEMHSMPFVGVHPNGKWMLMQSLDNQVVTYSALNKFQVNRKKVFKGHTTAGYACQVGCSTDGRYVISGDGDGRCFFWDWKTCKIFRTLKAHDGVCIGCEWHPLESSKVATCGWDGLIKYWD